MVVDRKNSRLEVHQSATAPDLLTWCPWCVTILAKGEKAGSCIYISCADIPISVPTYPYDDVG